MWRVLITGIHVTRHIPLFSCASLVGTSASVPSALEVVATRVFGGHQDPDQRRNSTDSDVIHHLYFEDNDGFFPPSWIGSLSRSNLVGRSRRCLQNRGDGSHQSLWSSGVDPGNFEGTRDTSTSAYKGST
jgi:hypothetical protein